VSRHRLTREESDARLGGLVLVLCLVGLAVCVVLLILWAVLALVL
jgi:hypothetical protein